MATRSDVIDAEAEWMRAMRRGDFAAAWQVSDAVLRSRVVCSEACTHWPRHLQFVWTGTPLDGARVLVRCYHGLGDTIQFVQLLPALRRRAREVTVWAQPSLLSLLGRVDGIDRLLPLADGEPPVEHDADMELMEIAHALRLELADLPGRVPYIYVSPAPPPGDSSCHVGLVPSAGDWDTARSIPSRRTLEPLRRVEGIAWHSLQYPPEGDEFPESKLACEDIVELASRMRALDLVLTVDTMTAHLAGALGLPVWLMLAEPCDWRWMEHRSDSPWYPTMQLFRQSHPGDWDGVVAQIARALPDFVAAIRARDTRSAGCTAS